MTKINIPGKLPKTTHHQFLKNDTDNQAFFLRIMEGFNPWQATRRILYLHIYSCSLPTPANHYHPRRRVKGFICWNDSSNISTVPLSNVHTSPKRNANCNVYHGNLSGNSDLYFDFILRKPRFLFLFGQNFNQCITKPLYTSIIIQR